MKKIFLLGLLCLGVKNTVQAKVTPGVIIAHLPLYSDNHRKIITDSSLQALLNDVAATYNEMEKNIELMYNKLVKETRDNIQNLNEKIKDIDGQISKLKEQAKNAQETAEKISRLNKEIDALIIQKAKARDEIKKLDALIMQLETDKEKSLADIRAQKEKAIREITRQYEQKKSKQAREYSIQLKQQTLKATEDSSKLIKQRYQGKL